MFYNLFIDTAALIGCLVAVFYSNSYSRRVYFILSILTKLVHLYSVLILFLIGPKVCSAQAHTNNQLD